MIRIRFAAIGVPLFAFSATIAFAGFQIQVDTITDLGKSFHRVAIVPCPAAEGVDPAWVDSLLLEKLTARHIAVVPAAKLRQLLFDLGATHVNDENKATLAEKLQVDAFHMSSVGSATTDTIAIIPLPYAGAPILKTSGAVELTLVAADSGRMLMHGVASGGAGFRTKKSVIGGMFNQLMDRAFTPAFSAAYMAKH